MIGVILKVLVLLVLALFNVLQICSQSIYISQPPNDVVYTLNKNSISTNLALEFQILGLNFPIERYEFCLRLSGISTADSADKELDGKGRALLMNVCVPASYNQLTFNDLKANHYTISAYLQLKPADPTEELQSLETSTLIENTFTIFRYDDSIPRLSLKIPLYETSATSNRLYAHISPTTGLGEFKLDYDYTKPPISFQAKHPELAGSFAAVNFDYSNFAMCIKLADFSDRNKILLNWSCMAPKDRSIALSKLSKGHYFVQFILKDVHDNTVINDSLLERELQIVDPAQLLPSVELSETIQEYVVDTKTKTTNVQVHYQYHYYEDDHSDVAAQRLHRAILSHRDLENQIQTCIEVVREGSSRTHSKQDEVVLPMTCLESQARSFQLSNMNVGQYQVILAVVSKSEIIDKRINNLSEFSQSQSKKTFNLDIREPVEFIPSYDWQPLHAWHTIPSGIETHLPLGKGARKEARIPEPWRLQLTMPSPCKYFLRMDVQRNTRLTQILDNAAKKCKMPTSCFNLVLDHTREVNEYTLSSEDTVESSNLFNVAKELTFTAGCS